jgi:hypothetical protein
VAATWGEAEVQVHVDGTALPREVREITSAAGSTGGETFGKSFKKSLRASMGDALNNMKASFGKQWEKTFIQGGRNAGFALTRGVRDGMKTFRLEFDKVSQQITRATESIDVGRWDSLGRSMRELGQAMPDVSNGFRQLAIEGGAGEDIWEPMLEDIGELRQVMDESGESARRTSTDFRILWRELEAGSAPIEQNTRETHRMRDAWAGVRGMWGGAGKALKRLGGAFDDFNNGPGARHRSMWKRLSANTRQWTLIIGAVIGAMGQLAGLAAAAGAGLFVLLGAFGSLLVGVVGFIAIFSALNQELEDAPEHMKPLIKEFQGFKKVIKQTGDEIASAAFAEMGGAFDSLSATVKGLNGPLRKVGTTLGRLFADFAKSIAPGTEAFGDLYTFIENSADVLDRLIRAVGRFAGAIVKGFNKAMPLTEMMLGWIDKLVDNFTAFVEGPGFDEWIRHAMDVFGPFGDLLDTIGGLLNDMVTDETIGQLVDFIENIDRFLQGGGKGILDFAQKLDIFGLLAKMLADFGDALEPLAGPMADFAEAINQVVQSGIETLAPIIEDIATVLAPFVQAVADFMKQNPKKVADALIALSVAFGLLKAVKIGRVAIDMLAFSTSIGVGGQKIKAFDAKKLGRIGRVIGSLAAVFAVQMIPDDFWEQFDIESNLPSNVLTGAAFGAMFGAWGIVIGAGIGAIYSLFTDFEHTFNDMGTNLVSLLVSGPMGTLPGEFATWFASLVPEEWRTSENPFKQAMAYLAEAVANPGTFLTTLPEQFEAMWTSIEGGMTLFGEAWNGFWAAIPANWANMWSILNNPEFWYAIADSLGEWIASLIDGFNAFLIELGGQWYNFWAGLPVVLANAWSVIMATIAGWWNSLRSGFTTWYLGLASAWYNFWNGLPKDPAAVGTAITATITGWWNNIKVMFAVAYGTITSGWTGFWNGLVGVVRNVVNTIIGIVNRLFGPIADALGRLGNLGGAAPGGGKPSAAGTVAYGPRQLLVGEDGPEAVVPLRRSLGRVNPAVRGLSAIAQGKEYGGSPGVGLAGRVVNINEGAIVIQGARDPNADAVGVVNRIAERVAS